MNEWQGEAPQSADTIQSARRLSLIKLHEDEIKRSFA